MRGYQIYYTGPTEGNLSADSIDINNEIIIGLVNGQTYHFSVAGKSAHLESEAVAASISLSKLSLMVNDVEEATLRYSISKHNFIQFQVPLN